MKANKQPRALVTLKTLVHSYHDLVFLMDRIDDEAVSYWLDGALDRMEWMIGDMEEVCNE